MLKKARAAIAAIGLDAQGLIESVSAFSEDPLARGIGSRRFLEEVVEAANSIGLKSARVAGPSILAFPNRLTVDEKGLKIGRKVIASIRPTAIAQLLKADAEKAQAAPSGFIDALRAAYDARATSESSPVALSEIYELLTLMPHVRKDYPESDFIRDLSMIDAFGPYNAKKDGKRISFVASTSTRMGKGYPGVSPSGEEVTYGSIRFLDAS